jgi:hypothetical protein
MTLRVRPEEPGLDPEVAVQPAFLPNSDNRAYCAWPNERHRWLTNQIPKLDTPVVRRFHVDMDLELSAKGPGCATAETAFTVHVKELCYPGGRWDFADADNKWLYAFHAGKLVVEACCVRGDIWDGWTLTGAAKRPWRSACGVRLDPGPRDRRYEYAYYLSPVQLTPEAIQDLQEGDPGSPDLGIVAEACDVFDKTIYVPDPLRWACEANERYYQPRLRTLLAWDFDEGIRSYAFVAGVLKRWIDDGDRVGAKNELRRSPESWLEEHKAGRARAQRQADEAAAYLAHCVDSLDYAAVEKACMARGDEALELAAVALSQAISGVLATGPGKKLAQQLAGNPARLPARLIFQESGPKLPEQWFERRRFGQKALLGIFEALLPASLQLALLGAKDLRAKEAAQANQGKKLTPRVRESLALRERAVQHLENLRVKTKLNKKDVRILENLRAGRPITKGAPRHSATEESIRKEWQKVIRLEEVRRPAPTKGEVAIEKAEKASKRFEPYYEKHATRLSATAGTAVEAANLFIAIVELKEKKEQQERGEATTEEIDKKRRSVSGALADFVEHGAGVAREFVEHGAEMAEETVEHEARMADALLKEQVGAIREKKLLTFVGGAAVVGHVAGVIGATIDMLDFEELLVEAIGEYDYGKTVGRSMQVAGAAGSVAGSAMYLAGMVVEGLGAGSSLGPAGAAVGGVGGALVAGGFLLAKWLSLNANEVFASRCFLGKHWEEVAEEVSWSRDRIPTKDPKLEAKVLIDLLSQFQLSCHSDLGDWRVLIHPAYVEDEWTFEVAIERHALNSPSESYGVVVDLMEDEVQQTAGLPLKAGKVRRDDHEHVEYIEINLEEAVSRESGFGWQQTSATVLVRLLRPEGQESAQHVPSNNNTAVRIGVPTSDRVWSLDKSVWVALQPQKELK